MGELAADVDRFLIEAGFNLRGVLAARNYDECVPPAWRALALLPEARSALVIGSGGRALYEALKSSPEIMRRDPDPFDAYTVRIVREAAAKLIAEGFPSVAGFAHERLDGDFADFVALGRASGLGADSRLGMLLHRRYGPWMSLRAVVLTACEVDATPVDARFDPCRRCPAPCARACPGGALDRGHFSVSACFQGRVQHASCRQRCDARRSCVLGTDHAYLPACEAHHMSSSLAMLSLAKAP
jgi:hypothetical protein